MNHVSLIQLWQFALICAGICIPTGVPADDYQDHVVPYMQQYCMNCHAGADAKGELDFTKFKTASDVIESFRRWKHVIEFIRDGEMPPEDAPQPAVTESNQVVAAIESILISEAQKLAGDPGVVLPRRLSNTEYDLSIRELTGVDIRPTKDFPADPAGGEGFDNTGEALRMSPNLLKKYLTAAQLVADHMVLKPDGMFFAPFPVTSYNERKKLTEQAIIDFYHRHAVDTLDYLDAAWRFRNRPADQIHGNIEEWATTRGLSGKYLSIIWNTLHTTGSESALSRELNQRWQAIPAPMDAVQRPVELMLLAEFIEFNRSLLAPPPQQLIQSNAGNWPISHLAFRTKVAAGRDHFDPAALKTEALLEPIRISKPQGESPESLSVFIQIDHGFSDDAAYLIVKQPIFSQADHLPRNDDEKKNHNIESLRSVLARLAPTVLESLKFGFDPIGDGVDADSFVVKVPATIEIPISGEMQQELDGRHLLLPCTLDLKHSGNGSVLIRSSLREPTPNRFDRSALLLINQTGPAAHELSLAAESFCQTFPDRFYYVDDSRGLAAGFHLVEGFFRDDRPLVEKVLNDEQNAALDRLWEELNFVTEGAESLLRGFVWFERSEREVLHDERFDFLRSEDLDLVEESKLGRFEKLYLDKLGVKLVGDTLEAESPDDTYRMIHGFFDDIRAGLARHRELLSSAETKALSDLDTFARRAYRRPLRVGERESLVQLYRTLRGEGQDVEDALRGVLMAVLMSPEFFYHFAAVADGFGVYPLSDHDLASRLSLFLWSTLPDDELLAVAEDHRLQDEDQLLAQTRRMLKDPRISAFAREFFGQWLRYRDYLQKDPINAPAFPGYNDELRAAIFEEPMRLVTDLIQNDLPVTALLNSDETFVNRILAAHYGGDVEKQYLTHASEDSQANVDARDVWYSVNGLKAEGRGGLFGMAIILTKNSAGERTSPVKRGFWTVHHLLGQHFPPPPADVPELPKSEKEASQTIRELLAAHVADAKCAMCHKHFDSLGLAMEGFDGIGRSRTKDSAGRSIDNLAKLPNGETARGIPGLIEYIEQDRREEFLQTLCRKFLGYALGRSVQLSDEPLLAEMKSRLAANDYRFSALFEVVVRSPQFRQQRGRDFVTASQP